MAQSERRRNNLLQVMDSLERDKMLRLQIRKKVAVQLLQTLKWQKLQIEFSQQNLPCSNERNVQVVMQAEEDLVLSIRINWMNGTGSMEIRMK